jgi:hypothetical protein
MARDILRGMRSPYATAPTMNRMRRTAIAAVVVVALLIAASLAFVLTGKREHGHPDLAARATPSSSHHLVPSTQVSASSSIDAAGDLYSESRDELLALQREKGSAEALEELDVRSRANSELGGVCHAIAHDLGHAALQLADGKPGRALTVRNDVCGGGFTHGVIEDALATSKNPARDLLRICAPKQDGSCFHGVGHGVMFATGLDVAKSIDLCDLAPSTTLSVRCGEGVFMQLFSADVAGGHAAGKGANAETVATARGTCSRTRMPYAGACWFYTPTLWLAERPDDFTGVMGWCASAPSDFGRELCAKGVGSRTIKYHPDDPTIGARVCAGAGELMDECLAGMGSYWSVHHKGLRPASDVCSRLGSARLERRCLQAT